MLGLNKKKFAHVYPDVTTLNFCKSLRALRLSLGLSVMEVSKYTKIKASSIYYYETSTRLPSLGALIRLSDFYKVDISDSINWQVYNGRICLKIVRKDLKKYGYSVIEAAHEMGSARSALSRTINGHDEGALKKLGKLMDIIKHEKKAEKFRNGLIRGSKRKDNLQKI